MKAGLVYQWKIQIDVIAGQCATARSIIGTSRIKNIIGYKKAGIIGPEPNTSLYFPVTLLPYLTGVAESGKQVFISVISGVYQTSF